MPVLHSQSSQQHTSNRHSVDRSLSWEDLADDSLSPNVPCNEVNGTVANYRFVSAVDRTYRKPPVHFSVAVLGIDGDTNKKTCYPGSTFEGIVKVKLDTPLAAQHLKLVFRGEERIHNDAIGRANKKRGDRFFAIRTILWGSPAITNNQWPVIEAGEHLFPFMCEIPMVNYPPTFRHHLVTCEFEVIASLERPGLRPFQTVPFSIRYEPLIPPKAITTPTAVYQEKLRLDNAHNIVVTILKGCNYNLLDTRTDSMKVQLSIINTQKEKQAQDSTTLLSHIEACIKREVDVTHGSYHRTDTLVMTHVEQAAFGVGNHHGARTYYITIPIPTESSQNNNPTILKNFSVLGMTTSVDFAKHTQLQYNLYITAKVRHGLLWTKRQLFCIPLYFCTSSSAEELPSCLVNYNDPSVMTDDTLLTKPKFIRPPSMQEQLPAYDEEPSPPVYCTDSPMMTGNRDRFDTATSSRSNTLQLLITSSH